MERLSRYLAKKFTLAFFILISSIGLSFGQPSAFIPDTFLDLSDTPNSYSGQGGQCVAVNGGATALEFVACGSGGGDSITVNSTTVDTTGNLLDNIYIDFSLTDGGAGGPDDITSKFNYNAASGDHALGANEGAFAANGFVFEGATADTIELYFAIPDPATSDKTITFPNATDTLVGKATTDTLTNKTLAAADNVIGADTAVALAANGADCSAGSAPLGVDASGAVESCTDYEEDLSNSAGLLAALSDETGTSLAVFSNSPVFTDDFDLAAAGVRMTGSNGTLTILGLGDGADENLVIDFNTTLNSIDFSSGTLATEFNLGTMDLNTDTIDLTGTGTLNGLDAIDATTETTLEAAIDIAGDVSGTGLGAVAIGNDKVTEAMLKAVDAAVDEDILTYESTTGDFEWHTCAQITGSADLCDGNDATGGSSIFTDGTGISYLTDTAEDFAIGNTTLASPFSVDVSAQTVRIGTGATSNAILAMYATDGDTGTLTYSTSDTFSFEGGNVGIGTTVAGQSLETTGDIKIGGDDLFMATNTDAFILVADGTNFNPVAMSGDITITNAGATAIGNDKVVEADLKAVDAAVDEECLTYESTTGDFEWQSCGSGGGGATEVILPIYSAKISGVFVTDQDATQGAQIDAGDGNWRLLFDATTDEGAVWQFRMPNNYSSTPVLKIHYTMASATANEVEFEGAIMCVTDADAADVGTASFSTIAVGSATVPGTAGYMDVISITLTDDSCAAGDAVWVYLSTDADDAVNDDATGDREVIDVSLAYTGS